VILITKNRNILNILTQQVLSRHAHDALNVICTG